MSLQDNLFSEDVEKDIREFVGKEDRKRVLVFPPVNNYRRFLIHQFVQKQFHDILYTFSIGQGVHRRTVVCYKTDVIRDPKLNGALPETCSVFKIPDSACAMGVEGRKSPLASPENSRQRQVKSVPSIGIYRPPPARKARCDNQTDFQQDQPVSDSLQSSKASRQKRPDRAVYVPRHRRSNEAGGSSLSRESSRVPKSTQERCSTTSSPAHTSSKSGTDNSGVETDSCHTRQETETVVSTAVETERNSCCAFESPIKHNFSQGNVAVDNLPISSSCSSLLTSTDKVTDENLLNLEINAFTRSDSETVVEQRDENCLESISQKDYTSTLNRVNEGSKDVCLATGPELVQTETELKKESQPHETGLILDGCEIAVKKSEINQDKESKESITNEKKIQSAVIEGDEGSNKFLECDEISSKGKRSRDSLELIMSADSNKKEETKEELINRDEIVNHKNRRIVRQNVVSDVLLISDDELRQETVISAQPPVVPVSPLSQTKEKKVKKVERPKSKPAPPPLPPSKLNRDECDWDSLFDDNGDCLDPTLIEELTTAVGEVTIEQPKSDYRAYSKAPVEVSNDEFAHVVEIYNFPSDFKTSDLAAVFSPFKNGGFELKWVDDTHCLGVFSSPLIAAEVLASDHSFVKTRPLSEATALSKMKAKRSAEFLQPYRARPETCAALARRLVTGALGVRLATARQEREREKIVLREAKERRRLANKQREDTWEGIIADK